MRIGVFTTTKCTFARYSLIIGNNFQFKVSGRAILLGVHTQWRP